MLTVRLVGGRRVSTGNTLHVLKAAQLGLPVIPEKEGKHTHVCVLVPSNNENGFAGGGGGGAERSTHPGRQSPHSALLVVEQLPFWERLMSPQSRQGLHFCRPRSSLKRLLRQGTHRASSP